MLNLLAKLKPALSSEAAPAKLADLHARGEAARAAVIAAHDAFEAAVQRAAAGEGTWDDVATARTALLNARADRRLITKAADLADKHVAAETEAAAIDRAWEATAKACRERAAIAERLQDLLTKAGATFGQLVESTMKVHRSLPAGYPARYLEDFSVEGGLAAALVRTEYSRRGLPGGPHLEGTNPRLLADRYKVATLCAERARVAAKEAAANG
jgi:hypothetical protein